MKAKRFCQVATMGAIAMMGSAAAYSNSNEIEELKARLAALEAQQAAKAEQAEKEGSSFSLSDRVVFGGLVEVEGFYTDNEEMDAGEDDKSASDLVVATVELGMEAQIAENVSAIITALYEEDDTDLEIDVAVLQFTDVAGFDITLGQDYLPFGSFDTHLVNDTLVLELAETRETTAMVGFEAGMFSAAAYVFNGDVDDGNNTLENYGIRLGLGSETFSMGADYISNVADSDALSDELAPLRDLFDTPDAIDVHAALALGPVTLLAEYFQADEFDAADWGTAADGDEYEPEAWHIEAGVEVADWTIAAAYQETDGVSGLLPEERISLGAGTDITENLSVTIEYWHDEDYGLSAGGSGEEADSIVAQVAVSF